MVYIVPPNRLSKRVVNFHHLDIGHVWHTKTKTIHPHGPIVFTFYNTIYCSAYIILSTLE
jgi:hypothetical protein